MTGIAKETATQHFMRLRSLLKMEYDYEKREYEKQSNEMDVQRAVSRGICWYPVRLGRGYYNSLNLFVVEVYVMTNAIQNTPLSTASKSISSTKGLTARCANSISIALSVMRKTTGWWYRYPHPLHFKIWKVSPN